MIIVAAQRPRFTERDARFLANEHYGLGVTAVSPLPSDRDQNFRLDTTTGTFVLKIANPGEGHAVLDFQNQVLVHLAAHHPTIPCPQIIPDRTGALVTPVQDHDGTSYFMRLVRYLPGVPLAEVNPQPPALFTEIGRLLGSLDLALQDFTHPAMHRELHWDMQHAATVIRKHRSAIQDRGRRQLVDHFLDAFESQVLPRLPHLRASVIHNDANDYNILIAPLDPEGTGLELRPVSGIIDFGDMVYTRTVFEPAIACAYIMLNKPDPLAAAAHLIQGYHTVFPLTEEEIALLYPLIAIRLCTSVCLSAHQRAQEPENEYLSISEAPAWALLEQLASLHPHFVQGYLRHACGFTPFPETTRIVSWLQEHTSAIAPLVPADLQQTTPTVFDLSIGSPLLGRLEDRDNPAERRQLLAAELARQSAGIGIGRYNEARQTHTGDEALADHPATPEPGTIHLGLDLYLPPGTPIATPLAGTVQHLVLDASPGPTVILQHRAAEDTFYTLYRHLDASSLATLKVGQTLTAGDRIGIVGEEDAMPAPHLHFQIITHLLNQGTEFPAFAPASSRSIWLGLCPDPNLLWRLPVGISPQPKWSTATLLDKRRQHLGYNLSISYRKPLKIVRGERQYLYDDEGRAYLDGVNNVCHVGHCHPHVVRALRDQASVLNTNTRYLHDLLVEYADRLLATFPEPLRVCYFVCTGSEANELALRLARAHTGKHDVMVVDGAYHGNTTTLIDMSPYKFKGRGGEGEKEYVHTVLMPDPYRGPHRYGEPELGRRYARYVQERIEQVHGQGRAIAAFFCESLLGCGGQIVLPDGYLEAAYKHARAAGAVCVADEVQVGFGRVGTHFWGFETQGVVPDIVTLGKPIGNGHPLAAVVTTPEIAASFNNGMEYFNTFGGNPVSCAVGLAVLDVIEQEGLQAHAHQVGKRLLAGLTRLKERHTIIGDVRGLGLFVGIELVLDRETRTPAGQHAAYVAERMRDHGILISTDGPDHNVLKLKPPLVFSAANADLLVETLDEILTEDFIVYR